MRKNVFASYCLTFVLASAAADDGITVVGVGEARGKPNALEFRAHLAGGAELAVDAVTKFNEYKRRALAAVDQLQFKELKVTVGAISILHGGDQNQAYLLQAFGQPNDSAHKMELALVSLFRVTLHDIDKMSEEKVLDLATQLVDKLKDAGVRIDAAQVGVNPADPDADELYGFPLLATFVLEDARELHVQARKRAFLSARADAAKLAELADLRLGSVAAVYEVSPDGNQVAETWEQLDLESPKQTLALPFKSRLVSRTPAEIPVRVSLRVRFRAEPKAQPAAGNTSNDAKTADVKTPGKEE